MEGTELFKAQRTEINSEGPEQRTDMVCLLLRARHTVVTHKSLLNERRNEGKEGRRRTALPGVQGERMCVSWEGVPVKVPGGEPAWGVSWWEHTEALWKTSARAGGSARNGVGPGICWLRTCGLLGLSLRAEGHT